MKIFVTSDLHFGHSNIISLCNRPFKDVTEMNETIISNWNSVVGETDTVYVLGDFSFKGDSVNSYLDRLNGNIILIKGNHDKEFSHKKLISSHDYLEIQINTVSYVLCHYPIIAWNKQFKNAIHLYGHVHSTGRAWEFVNLPNAHNVCCEFYDYTPVEISTFIPVDFVQNRRIW